MNKITWLYIGIIIVVIGGLVWLTNRPVKASALDPFATCINNSGAKFYGAFWCPHCKNQKALFGSSARLLPYVECSTPDGNSQNKTCTDLGVQSYPTWVFPDGHRETGEVSLAKLATLTSCNLPE